MSDDHDEMTRFVHSLAERVPAADPPLAGVLAAAHEASGRRSRWRVVVAAVAVAAAVVAVGLAPVVVGGRHTAPPPASTAPSAPPGMKLVGADGYAIAVPVGWRYRVDDGCPATTPSYTFVSGDGYAACSGTDKRVSSSTFGSVRSVDLASDLQSFHLADGRAVTRNTYVSSSSSVVRWRIATRTGTEEVSVLLTGADRALLDTIAGSLESLPDGWTTVPEWTLGPVTSVRRTPAELQTVRRSSYLDVLGEAGLVGRLGGRVDPSLDPRVTSPAQGSVVAVGSTVTLGSPVDVPTVDDGMRLVGQHGWVIAVPDTWVSKLDNECGVADPDVDYFDIAIPDYGVAVGCTPGVPPAPGVSHLDVSTVTGPGTPDTGSCDTDGCRHTWERGDVMFSADVRGPGARALVSAMGASLQLLPADLTTVPVWPEVAHDIPDGVSIRPIVTADYRQVVVDAGLVAVDGTAPPAGEDPRVTYPAQGTVLPIDGTVTLGVPAAEPPAPPGTPLVPDVSDLVGAAGVAVEVPATWHFGQTPVCRAPPSHAWWFLQPALQAAARCPESTPRVHHSSVAIGGARDVVAFNDLPPAVEGAVVCDHDGCIGQWTRVRHDVRFVAGAYGRGARALVTRLGASVRAVPSGFTTVPLLAVVETSPGAGRTDFGLLSHAGCVARFARAHLVAVDAGPASTSCSPSNDPSTDPAQGSVVAVGSSVTIG